VKKLSRTARVQSNSGIYHIMARGINRQEIFLDDEDCLKYLEIIAKCKKEGNFIVFGYCLMVNHLHLLLQEKNENISLIMKRIATSYAGWYNKKRDRIGHLFQDRYKSECVDDEGYLLSVIRYIHMNPVKAQMVEKPEEYKWSSCRAYYTRHEYPIALITTEPVLAHFNSGGQAAEESFRKFMEQQDDKKCLEYDIKKSISDSDLKRYIEELAGGAEVLKLHHFEREEMNRILRSAKGIPGSSLRQIARVTGIGVNKIIRA